jgi:hypothetical protein
MHIKTPEDLTVKESISEHYAVKKVNDFPVPSRDVTDQTLTGQE